MGTVGGVPRLSRQAHAQRSVVMAVEKSDKEKGEEILKARARAKKGLKPDAPEDAVEETEKREKRIARDWLGIGLGLKRNG
jgi:hypothetical protein